MKNRVVFGTLIAMVAVAASLYVLLHERQRPRRVWVIYSEKYQDADPLREKDYEQDADDNLFAEERLSWQISEDKTCMVLTHDKQKADYVVRISVVRYLSGGNTFGRADLSITKRNGDVILVESFYQDRKSAEDIAQQPITRTWGVLCNTEPR